MTRAEPTVLERLQAAGLRPELVTLFRDVHRKRKPCECRLCQARRRESERRVAA